jgi:hypothetical protein
MIRPPTVKQRIVVRSGELGQPKMKGRMREKGWKETSE